MINFVSIIFFVLFLVFHKMYATENEFGKDDQKTTEKFPKFRKNCF